MATINYGIFTAKTNPDQLELVEAAKYLLHLLTIAS